jgi:uncharacterized protein (UPF0264 family)
VVTAKERLVAALTEAGADQKMIDYAAMGGYDDFESQSATPMMDLVRHARMKGLTDIANRAMDGEFDADGGEDVSVKA